MKVLWICFVWPEPRSSAAGVRTQQLIDLCKATWAEVRVCSPCQSNSHQAKLAASGISTARFEPNDASFDDYIKEFNPDIVFFDRFMIEEQFSWRVRQHCPDALRILDTIDLHSLRRARELEVGRDRIDDSASEIGLSSQDAFRELAAIFRSDLTLITSDFELRLLTERYNVAVELLELCRLFYTAPTKGLEFDQRSNYVTIGNFNHPPNLDSVKLLHAGLWREIRSKLRIATGTEAELHIYGAYPSKSVLALDDIASGFRVFGWAEDASETLARYRVNLALLRFGAGIKGKISDGWAVGTPCVATSVAAEGMHAELEFGGIISAHLSTFAQQAVLLYTQPETWRRAQQNGIEIIKQLFDLTRNSAAFIKTIERLAPVIQERRQGNFIGSMLWYHANRSTEFFSRWIEAKNMLLKTKTSSFFSSLG